MCDKLRNPLNGLLLSTQEQFHFGDVAQFKCDFGYEMIGSSVLQCLSSGMWNGTAPVCKCKYIIL